MKARTQFDEDLSIAIRTQKEYVLKELLPGLKAEFSFFHASYNGLYKILIKNKLIQEDVYRKALKISEVQVPPKGQFQEHRAKEEMTVRLSLFDSHLEFLLSYCPFTLDYLTPKRLKVLAEFTRYLDWDNMTLASGDFNTYNLALLTASISKQTHDLTSQILKDSQKQLSKHSKIILRMLKDVSVFSRELYKYEIREQVMEGMTYNEADAKNNPENMIEMILKDFKIVFPMRPVYKDLFKEIVEESYGRNSEFLQKELLQKLRSRAKKEKIEKPKESHLDFLERAIKALAMNDPLVTEALIKMDTSWTMSQDSKSSFGERLLKLFGIVKSEQREKICDLVYEDESTGARRNKSASLVQFIGSRKKLLEKVNNLNIKFASSKNNLSPEEEENLALQLNKYIHEYIKTAKDMTAFNDYFKRKAPPEKRSKLKGIKIEISAINTNIQSARKYRNSYDTKREENRLLGGLTPGSA